MLPPLDKGSRAHFIKATRKSPSRPEGRDEGGRSTHICTNPFLTLSEIGQVELSIGRNFLSNRTSFS